MYPGKQTFRASWPLALVLRNTEILLQFAFYTAATQAQENAI
jgi:hypothetical protein